ncbi:MAG: 4Fe-4S dicluster domain-containing protein [Clostridiales bacterium]|nr:4Fe-4S dicluster domain-containing protein [Clostridiales bacterium]
MLTIPLSQVDALFSLIDSKMPLYIPIQAQGQVSFGRWAPDAQVRLDHLLPARPVKEFFFPQTENIASFQTKGKELVIEESREASGAFAVFGVRACDARSVSLLDRVFFDEPADTFYQARREGGILIALACGAPEETCFCTAFGVDPTEPGGDVSAWLSDKALYWECLTEKGAKLTALLSDLLTDAGSQDEEAVKAQQEETRAILGRLPLNDLDLDGFTGDSTMDFFDAPQWKGLHEACLGCGACTFICPTCHCYDIQDFDTGHGVRRFRCWDSCMYSDFTLMSHGNPRQSQLERFRQRFMHKLVYYPANHEGIHACVGCGRCISKCPVSANITKVINTLGVDQHVS